MPEHVNDTKFNIGETVVLGDGLPYIKGDAVVYLDSDDGLHKRYRMDKGALVLQYFDTTGNKWENV